MVCRGQYYIWYEMRTNWNKESTTGKKEVDMILPY